MTDKLNKTILNTVEKLTKLLPVLDKPLKRLSAVLYLELTKGKVIKHISLAKRLSLSESIIQQQLKQLPELELNSENEITGYRGVTLCPTAYRITISSKVIYTWCAFDALFFFDLVKSDLEICCSCKQCDAEIILSENHLRNPNQIQNMMSFVTPSQNDYSQNLQKSFCCQVHFFCNKSCGDLWIEKKQNLHLFNIEDALAIAKQRNKYFLGV